MQEPLPSPEDVSPPLEIVTHVTRPKPRPFQGRTVSQRTIEAHDATKVCIPPEPWETPPPWVDADDSGLTRRCYVYAGERAAALVRSLLDGSTYRSACIHAGLRYVTVQKLRERDAYFNELVTAAWDAGFSILEDELVTRALNGADDKASIRALELALKSRDPNYRDQRTVDVTLRAAAANARQRVVGSRGEA